MVDVAVCKIPNEKVMARINRMKPSILYLLTSLNTTGGTVSKIKSTLKFTRYNVFIGAHYNSDDGDILKCWEQENNVQVINLPSRGNIFQSVYLLNNLIRREKISMVHSFFPNEMFIAYILKLLNPNLKIIRSFEGNVKRSFLVRALSRMMLPSFDEVIFISKYVSDFYEDITRKCKNKTIVDNAGYHISEYQRRDKGEICTIVSVAGLNLMKNVFMYAEIGRVLKTRNFSYKMTIVGYGPLENKLRERIVAYQIQDSVILLGMQNDPKPYYKEADIYIHPADKEGFGITVAEAMSAGLPVIVSDRGGVPELVNHMEDGIIVDAYNPHEWADYIITLWNDRELYDKLSKNGHNTYLSRFTPKMYATNLDRIYDQLI